MNSPAIEASFVVVTARGIEATDGKVDHDRLRERPWCPRGIRLRGLHGEMTAFGATGTTKLTQMRTVQTVGATKIPADIAAVCGRPREAVAAWPLPSRLRSLLRHRHIAVHGPRHGEARQLDRLLGATRLGRVLVRGKARSLFDSWKAQANRRVRPVT